MANYDFSCLNDKEFESLSVDVLSAHIGQRIERFKSGKDKGVDGRYFSAQNEEIILQCKHWQKSGLSALLRYLNKSEVYKVRKLNPSKYIFVTSLELSRENKIQIKKIFSPFILNESDIYGNEDINDIISSNSAIEQKHYKLWLTSTNVIQTILGAAIVGRSKFKLEEIIEDTSRYVITVNHERSLKKLEELHTVIITGEPGIGKTSLADQLCQHYAANDYELCYIENSLNEAEEHYKEASKQVFYFDDFLGRNFLLALDHHQDSHVVNFIKRVQRDAKKRFILTSRSNILNQGKRLSDLFVIKHIDKNEYEITISSLSDFDKAKILYNHIWYSKIDESYIEEIYKEKRYRLIIRHRNFNPRLISFITDPERLKEINPDNYWEHIENTLATPEGVWSNVFDIQLDDVCRHMVVAVAIHGRRISESSLERFFYRLKNTNLNIKNAKSFDMTMRLLVGALLNRSITSRDEDAVYDLFNPSIADYVIATYLQDVDYIEQLINCLSTTGSIDNLSNLYCSGSINKSTCKNLVEKAIFSYVGDIKEDQSDVFLIRLLSFGSDILNPSENMCALIEKVSEILLNADTLSVDYHTFKFIDWAMDLNRIRNDDERLILIIDDFLRDNWPTSEEYSIISNIVLQIEYSGGILTNAFKEKVIVEYSSDITSKVIEAGVLPDVYDKNDESIDYSDIADFIKDELIDISIGFTDSEIEDICYECDMSEVAQSNIDATRYEDQAFEGARDAGYGGMSEDNIDDLFDRG